MRLHPCSSPLEATVWLPKLLSVLCFGIGCFETLLGIGPRALHTISKPHITEQFFISLKAYCILFTDCVVPVHAYMHHGMHVKSDIGFLLPPWIPKVIVLSCRHHCLLSHLASLVFCCFRGSLLLVFNTNTSFTFSFSFQKINQAFSVCFMMSSLAHYTSWLC